MVLTERFAKVKFNDHYVATASKGDVSVLCNLPRDRYLTSMTSNYYIFSPFETLNQGVL